MHEEVKASSAVLETVIMSRNDWISLLPRVLKVLHLLAECIY